MLPNPDGLWLSLSPNRTEKEKEKQKDQECQEISGDISHQSQGLWQLDIFSLWVPAVSYAPSKHHFQFRAFLEAELTDKLYSEKYKPL